MIARVKRYPWFSFFTLLIFCGLVALSLWQLQRLAWKTELTARIEAEEIRAPQVVISPEGFAKLPEFRRVIVSGRYLKGPVIELQGRYYQGNTGVHLLQPFRMKNGAVILVNRGWVPKDYKTDPRVKLTPENGFKTLVGFMRYSEERRFGKLLPGNNPEKHFWLWQDIYAMQSNVAAANPGANVLPVLLQRVRSASETDFPVAMDEHISLRNDHLQYAITWGALAIITLVMYTLYTQPKKKKSKRKKK